MIDRTYREPTSLEQARSMLAENLGLRIVAGGTDLVVASRSGKAPLPERLIAIHRLKELVGIHSEAGGALRIGALTTHADLEISEVVRDAWSALSDASALVGSPATRHMGTIGGNVCNASPAMELGSPLLVFDATLELASIEGVRSVPFRSFVTGPGRTSARPGEILIAVVLPPLQGRLGSAYMRLEYRLAMEIAIVAAAAMVRIDEADRCLDARVAITAVAPTCVRAMETEEVLRGKTIDSELLKRAAGAAVASARPIDDVRASADYRTAMVPVMVRRALEAALDRAQRRRSS